MYTTTRIPRSNCIGIDSSFRQDVDGAAEEGRPFIPAHGMRRIVFTPRPAGFRFYHTHNRAGAIFTPDSTAVRSDRFISRTGLYGRHLHAPQVVWTAGMRHRVRLINITPNDILNVSLRTSTEPVTWRPLAKDGAVLPAERSVKGSAVQVIAVGETYDFEYVTPQGRHSLWLEARSIGGKWHAQGQVIVK
jgi:hypothetical protein